MMWRAQRTRKFWHVAGKLLNIAAGWAQNEIFGRADLDKLAILHDRNVRAKLDRLGEVVGDEDNRLVEAGLDGDEFVLHLAANERVERAEWFVKEEDFRVDCQRALPGPRAAACHHSIGWDSTLPTP